MLLTLGARKYHHSIRRDNTSAVAGDDRVNPVVTNMTLQMAKQLKTNAG